MKLKKIILNILIELMLFSIGYFHIIKLIVIFDIIIQKMENVFQPQKKEYY
jgi:hypothetical protein